MRPFSGFSHWCRWDSLRPGSKFQKLFAQRNLELLQVASLTMKILGTACVQSIQGDLHTGHFCSSVALQFSRKQTMNRRRQPYQFLSRDLLGGVL